MLKEKKYDKWYYYMQGVAYGLMRLSLDLAPDEALEHISQMVRTVARLPEGTERETYVFPCDSTWGLLLIDRGRQEGLKRHDL